MNILLTSGTCSYSLYQKVYRLCITASVNDRNSLPWAGRFNAVTKPEMYALLSFGKRFRQRWVKNGIPIMPDKMSCLATNYVRPRIFPVNLHMTVLEKNCTRCEMKWAVNSPGGNYWRGAHEKAMKCAGYNNYKDLQRKRRLLKHLCVL